MKILGIWKAFLLAQLSSQQCGTVTAILLLQQFTREFGDTYSFTGGRVSKLDAQSIGFHGLQHIPTYLYNRTTKKRKGCH